MKVFVVLIVFLLAGCSNSFYSELPKEINIFPNELSPSLYKIFTFEDPEYIELDDWLRKNKDGWTSHDKKYSGGIIVLANNYGYQLTGDKIIVHSRFYTEPKSLFFKELKSHEIRGLRDLDK
jgi:hypothetical protein